MEYFIVVAFVSVSFLLGAISFGYIIAKKYYEINIQEFGSGNIGSTNVNRIIGKKAAIITQILDILKGLIPVLLGTILLKSRMPGLSEDVILIIAGASIIGHDFTPFLKFRGGKGVNTTLGATLIIAPIPTVISIVVFFIVKKLSSYVSVASMLIGITLPLVGWILNIKFNILIYLLFCGFLVIICHKENLIRLISGKENS